MGHDVTICDLHSELLRNTARLLSIFDFRTGYRRLQARVKEVASQVSKSHFDLVWVNGGELLGKKSVRLLRDRCKTVVLYNNDDPFGGRDGRRFDSLKSAVSDYSLCATVRDVNAKEYLAAGAPRALRVWMSYDELMHAPQEPSTKCSNFDSDVAFIGTWMRNEKRDEFLLKLIKHGLDIAIWGDRWEKSPRWRDLKASNRGPGIVGRDYVSAICGAKICLGFLSKGNRDLHTRRSVEIPYAGGLLCAERTSEHQMLYRDCEEAVFWDNAEECASVCKDLLADNSRREAIRTAGMKRIRELRLGNQDVCQEILDVALTGKTDIVRPFYAV